ncbi:MAG: signal peptidase I [Spirochaetales bacterium]|nr:signal peptidase I [Spirochaetales bacterium]
MSSLLILFIPLLSLFQVKDVSMEPVLKEGQKIIVLRTDNIRPGDLVVFTDPRGELAVKSCVLTGGDRIRIEGNYLVLNGRRWFLQPDQKSRLRETPLVPRDSFLLLGENSFHSADSREWGFIRKDVILGKVLGKKGSTVDQR